MIHSGIFKLELIDVFHNLLYHAIYRCSIAIEEDYVAYSPANHCSSVVSAGCHPPPECECTAQQVQWGVVRKRFGWGVPARRSQVLRKERFMLEMNSTRCSKLLHEELIIFLIL